MIKQEILDKINTTENRMAIANYINSNYSDKPIGDTAVYNAIKRRARILTTIAYIKAICHVTKLTQEEILETETAQA